MTCSNFIIANEFWHGDHAYFGDEPFEIAPSSATMTDLLVRSRCFPSKSQARKNWHGPESIPRGWSEWRVGKRPPRWLCVFSPIPWPTANEVVTRSREVCQ